MRALVVIIVLAALAYCVVPAVVDVFTNPPTVSRATEACAAHAEDC